MEDLWQGDSLERFKGLFSGVWNPWPLEVKKLRLKRLFGKTIYFS
jgi:hypothetical protein